MLSFERGYQHMQARQNAVFHGIFGFFSAMIALYKIRAKCKVKAAGAQPHKTTVSLSVKAGI
jgi:hypothetical protein